MLKKFYLNFLILITISVFLIFVSCAGEDADVPSAEAPAVEETAVSDVVDLSNVVQGLREEFPDISERAEEIISGIMSRGNIHSIMGRSRDDAYVYIYMAAAYEEEKPVTAGLRAMNNSFTGHENMTHRDELVDERYVQTVLYHLQSDNNLILSNAIAATEPTVNNPDNPSKEVLDRLMDLASNHPDMPVRYDVLDVLEKSYKLDEDPDRIQVFINNLDSEEAYLISKALLRMRRWGRNAADQDALQKKLIELLQHEDGGVRGRSAGVIAGVVGSRGDNREDVAKLIIPLMDDENTFARSEAFGALQTLDYRPAIHLIMDHFEDDADNRHEIEFTLLDGRAGRATHGSGTVNEAALNSLRAWSNTLGERFTFSISNQTREEDLANAKQLARQWYAGIKDDIPQP